MDRPAARIETLAHPNIALIKYWGKRDERLNLPAVGSLSITLDTMCSRVRVQLLDAKGGASGGSGSGSGSNDTDEIVLPGVAAGEAAVAKVRAYVNRWREALPDHAPCARRLRIESSNTFPASAGLASSASSFAALAVALDAVWQVGLSKSALSAWARVGSGSAARSLFGGFALMERGSRADGADAVAALLLAEGAWDLRVVVAIVSETAKSVSSSEGMRRTVHTSPYWRAWVEDQPADLAGAVQAVAERDLARLAALSEHSCLKMHALAMAASPGLIYWKPTTLAVLEEVRSWRAGGLAAFFTIDAGPQVKVVCEASAVQAVEARLAQIPGILRIVSCRLGPGAHVVARQ